MLIHELTRQECLDLLARVHIGKLACAQGMQPYIVPIHFAYENFALYIFSMVGKKIEWMRANPLVCVEADDIVSAEQWTSVIVFGRYEELSDTRDLKSERSRAIQLLQERAVWWEPGYAKITHDGTRPQPVPVFCRINVAEITGRRAAPEPGPPDTSRSTADSGKGGWLEKLLRRFRRT